MKSPLLEEISRAISDLRSIGYDLEALEASSTNITPHLNRLKKAMIEVDQVQRKIRSEQKKNAAHHWFASGIDPQSKEVKLHLGSGESILEGWVNIDQKRGDLRWNLQNPFPMESGIVKFIYLAHVLEHFHYPGEALSLLQQCHRVLEENGVIRIVVPDIEQCIQAYVKNDPEFFESRKQFWDWAKACETRLEHFLAYAGAGAVPQSWKGHKFGYDYETLAALLKRAGFRSISQSSFMVSSFTELRVDDRSKTAVATYSVQSQKKHYSLFVEARK